MARFLKGNQGTECPSNVFFIDCETRRADHDGQGKTFVETFRLGVVTHCKLVKGSITHQETFTFYETLHFWTFLESKLKFDRSNWVFGHNLHAIMTLLEGFDRFLDGTFILDEKHANWPMRKAGIVVKRPWKGMAILEQIPFLIRCRSKKGTIVFADQLNYFPVSLEELAENIGIVKLPAPCAESLTPDLVAHCTNKVSIVKSAITNLMEYWQREDLGNWNMTAAGLSLNSWRHRFAPKIPSKSGGEKINCLIHDHPEALKLERESYHGGEVHAFFRGYISPVQNQFDTRPWKNETLYHVDCRSLFPFSMLHSYVPHQLRKYYEKTTPAQLKTMSRQHGMIASVRLNTPTIPFVTKHNGQVVYACGEFWTVLAGDELIRALDENLVVDSGAATTYYMNRLFAKYVKYWWSIRKEAARCGNRMMDSIAKMAMNSLYGKFAQKSSLWKDIDTPPIHQWFGHHYVVNAVTAKVETYRFFCGYAQQLQEQGESRNSFPAISSFITSNAREYMRQIREKLPIDSVYYQHTDSFICNGEAFQSLQRQGLLGDDIGQFREVDPPCCNAEIFGPGDYVYGGKVVRTGKKANAINLDHDRFSQYEFGSIHETIASGPSHQINVRLVELSRRPKQAQGCLSPSSFLLPLVLSLPSLPSSLPSPVLQSLPSLPSQSRLFP